MLGDVMAICLLQNLPLFQTHVNCLLSHANNCLHGLSFIWVCQTGRALYLVRSIANIPNIGLNTLISIKPQ